MNTQSFRMSINVRVGNDFPTRQIESIPVVVTVDVDMEKIAKSLALKAFRNKHRTSKLAVGVKVTAVRAE